MGNCLRRLTSRFNSVFSKSQDDKETSPLLDRKRPTPVDTQVISQKQSASVDRRFTVGACQSIEGTGQRSDKYRLRRLTSRFHSVFSKSQDDEETSPIFDRKRLTSVDTQVIREKQSALVDRRFTIGACQSIEGTGRRSDKYSRITERKDGESPILESQLRQLQESQSKADSNPLFYVAIVNLNRFSENAMQFLTRKENLTELQRRSRTIVREADGFENLSRQLHQKQQGHHCY